MRRPPIVVVEGPTASCLSRLAVALALRLFGEVLSCVSILFLRGMVVG